MDRVVKVRRSFLNEIRAFCNQFAKMCDGCFKAYCDCLLADSINKAKNLIVVLDNLRDAEEEKFYIENPYEELLDRVESAIAQGGGKPVRSSEIFIPGVYRQRKARAISKLLKRGRIEMTLVRGEPFYVVCRNDRRNNKHNRKHNKGKDR